MQREAMINQLPAVSEGSGMTALVWTTLRIVLENALCRGVSAIAIALVAVVPAYSPSAYSGERIYSIGSLNTADQFINSFEGFRERMGELGYRDGKNVRYQYYNSRGNAELLRTLARRLVRDKVDMIVTSSTTGTVVAAKATEGTPIPVLFLSSGNPQALVKGFASSGSNLAGISSASLELMGRRFELLKELSPKAKRVALPLDPKNVNYKATVSETREAAGKLNLIVVELPVASTEELAKVTGAIQRKSYDAIFSSADSVITEGIDVLVGQSVKEKLPLITSLLVNVQRGCLATYAADYAALGKQGAVLAHKIFRGAKPADLPIELPHKINLALNLTTAKAIGLNIPKEIMLRADVVIE
ncbi:MAG TPA: ABC transporter substrate-binding protein [Candidatus Limnocylindria bacterium]|nr:ABC transporter substrate-binding protein [Candidatus Limnocylindria bacterium]